MSLYLGIGVPKARRERDISGPWNFVYRLNWPQLKSWNGQNFELAPPSGQKMGLKVEIGTFSTMNFSRIVTWNSFETRSNETFNAKKEQCLQKFLICYHLVLKSAFRKFITFLAPKNFLKWIFMAMKHHKHQK